MSEKKEKPKSVFQVARELEEQQRQDTQAAEAKALALAEEKKEQERIAYEKRIREERIELMRLKQGLIDESETIREETGETRKYSFWERTKNYFYHNKWWLWIAAFFVFVGGFLVVQQVTTVRPDMVVLLISDDADFATMCSKEIADLFEQYIGDENGDGKTLVEVYYIPASENESAMNAYSGNSTKLFAEFQIGQSLLVISDDEADEFIQASQNLVNLEEFYPDNPLVQEHRFLLSETDFARDVDWPYAMDADIYIGIRRVKQTFDDAKEMQENFDIAFPVLQKFIAAYSE